MPLLTELERGIAGARSYEYAAPNGALTHVLTHEARFILILCARCALCVRHSTVRGPASPSDVPSHHPHSPLATRPSRLPDILSHHAQVTAAGFLHVAVPRVGVLFERGEPVEAGLFKRGHDRLKIHHAVSDRGE